MADHATSDMSVAQKVAEHMYKKQHETTPMLKEEQQQQQYDEDDIPCYNLQCCGTPICLPCAKCFVQ